MPRADPPQGTRIIRAVVKTAMARKGAWQAEQLSGRAPKAQKL